MTLVAATDRGVSWHCKDPSSPYAQRPPSSKRVISFRVPSVLSLSHCSTGPPALCTKLSGRIARHHDESFQVTRCVMLPFAPAKQVPMAPPGMGIASRNWKRILTVALKGISPISCPF